ncbi:hypothetical protein OCU04_005680 [Sclerotinia nivalis]|uniref:RBR-type E3 ubiquitin transferase n=1 Tax=Sclerotinia nivalis TaxID=352851 RepID=A0A9X0DM16_9HELO|nr:hypothetical protein OCU04_005680 [Sclerotinia nivalis]
MTDSPPSGSARPILRDSTPPGYLRNANLPEFPAPPTTNIQDEREPEPQMDATDMEKSPESDSNYSPSLYSSEGWVLTCIDYTESPDSSGPPNNFDGIEDDNDYLSDEYYGHGIPDNLEQSMFYRPSNSKKSTSQFQCTICHEQRDVQQTAVLMCGCVYCSSCIKIRFTLAIEAEYMFPAECCEQTMDLSYIRHFLSADILRNYEVKAIEYGSTDRTYCANTDCLAFIVKESIQGNKAFCTNSPCDTVTCVKCKGKWHEGDCPADEALQLVLAEAEKFSWKRCAECGTLIEHKEGCAHMRCQCGHQFCYCCTAIWKTCDCTQDELDHALGVAHPYADNEPVIEYGENNEDDWPILGHRGVNPVDRRPTRTPYMTGLPRTNEDRTGNEASAMDTPTSNAPPATMGMFERFAHDYVPGVNRDQQSRPSCGTREPRINEHNRSTVPASSHTMSQTVQSTNGSASTPQNTNLMANNAFTHDSSQNSQRNTGLWSDNQLDGQTDVPSIEALGAQFQHGMHRLRDYFRSIEDGVDNHEDMTSSTLAPAADQVINATPDNTLDAETSLSFNDNTNDDDDINTTPTSNPDPLLSLHASDPGFDNQTDTQLIDQQSELSSAPAITIQDSDTTDNTNTRAQRRDAIMMRRQRVRASLDQAWAIHEFLPNWAGYRDYEL